MVLKKGLILKGVGSYYYVKTPTKIYECKARGIFRQKSVMPLVGDIAEIEITSEDDDKGLIINIDDRVNFLKRPLVANVDQLIIVSSLLEPKPNILILDKLITICAYKNIEPILIFTKIDLNLKNDLDIPNLYKNSGFNVILIDNNKFSNDDKNKIIDILKDKISILIGNSGVGKSSLINNTIPDLNIETNIISKKLGRGKHTTTHTELFELEIGGYIADTPGFSTVDIIKYISLKKEDIQECFIEFKDYKDSCKFKDCSHIQQNNCEILKAVENNQISKSRYNSYVSIYNEIKNIKEWN